LKDHSKFYKTSFTLNIDETVKNPYVVSFSIEFLDKRLLERVKNQYGNLFVSQNWLPFYGHYIAFSSDPFYADDVRFNNKRFYDAIKTHISFGFSSKKGAEIFIKRSPGKVYSFFNYTISEYVKLRDEKIKLNKMVSEK
jgi:hypothetical protein